MSTAATQQQPPAVPPRPSRGSQDRDDAELPKIPPRPSKRGPSPNPDRYAPSPINGGLLSPRKDHRSNSNGGPIERSRSVDLPAVVGEEGMEYAALAEEVALSREPSNSPTQTRTVDENMKIYAPTATMPASKAKQRIMQVTRTDSDNAAAFGIGKPSHEVPTPSNRSLKKKASTASGLSHSEVEDEEHGIPEIGQQIPLLPNAGDVQAPSPAPGSDAIKSHKRKGSSRGLPPGSYGLHGHNVAPQDKLDKEYYHKHPELLKLEHHPYQADRPTDFALSSDQLNKLVRETEVNGQGVGTNEHFGTPSEQAGWAALDASSSRPQSAKPGEKEVHIEEPNRRRSILLSGDPVPAPLPEEDTEYSAPILAEDEVRKNTPQRDQVACVEPSRERRGSDYEADPPRSRPTSRPASLYKVDSSDLRSTPLEDVEEYEPLFPEDDEGTPKKNLTAAQIEKIKQRFPSKDIWEDAPNSVHHTATVSTPDLTEQIQKSVPPRDQTETPAQEWARKQEELAEKELTHPDAFLWRKQKPTWVGHQPHLSQEAARPKMAQKFPSRDVWEDTPDSLKLETTVSGPQMEPASPADNKPPVPDRPGRQSSGSRERPAIPERPKSKSPEETSKPQIPDRPKPQIPARPAKATASTATSSDAPIPKAKPAVPARPAGNKIAALQAGFMSDLNKKLGLGPRVSQPKEETKDEVSEEPKEKAPLTDARKGRARGPQRRAPAAATATAAAPAQSAAKKPKLSFSTTVTVWSLDPESEGTVQIGQLSPAEEKQEPDVPVTEPSVEKSAAPAVETSTDAKSDFEEAKASVGSESEPKLEEDAGAVDDEKKEEEPKATKQETLATNIAGESVEEAIIEEDKTGKVEAKHAEVNPVED